MTGKGSGRCKWCNRPIRWSHSGWWYHVDDHDDYCGIECDTFQRKVAESAAAAQHEAEGEGHAEV